MPPATRCWFVSWPSSGPRCVRGISSRGLAARNSRCCWPGFQLSGRNRCASAFACALARGGVETSSGSVIAATVSVGIAPLSVDSDPERIVAAADIALYRAKRSGRNQSAAA
ncbi:MULTISPECIES: GGDEF domain-containing protein [Novosphingobium]|uniref:GGDEF domain-containing protein n=1 Tax=Novosphingobium TaxID=165696 RepID=UPI0022F28570|nr:diguanylate cyclase [Novosphingobium resinovorum]